MPFYFECGVQITDAANGRWEGSGYWPVPVREEDAVGCLLHFLEGVIAAGPKLGRWDPAQLEMYVQVVNLDGDALKRVEAWCGRELKKYSPTLKWVYSGPAPLQPRPN